MKKGKKEQTEEIKQEIKQEGATNQEHCLFGHGACSVYCVAET